MNTVKFKEVMGKLENAEAYLIFQRMALPMGQQEAWEALQDAIELLGRCRGQVLREFAVEAAKGECT